MKKTLKTFGLAVLAGISIALGCTIFLSLENKVMGAMLFTVGLFTICVMGFNLFTGKVCYSNGSLSSILELIVIWLGNVFGTWLAAALLHLTRHSANLTERAVSVCQAKLDDSMLSIFILGLFCNILIYIAVESFKNNPHEVGKYIALFFGVSIFILCGFEHCVANMFYISMAKLWSGRAVAFIVVNSLGNAVGGLIFPLGRKYFKQ